MLEYMTSGGGRFAYPSLFGAVEKFFTATTIPDSTYTYSQLLDTRLGLNLTPGDLEIIISQYGTGLLSADLAERAYIFGTTQFRLNIDNAIFEVVGGVKTIRNIEVRAYDDNFDFVTDNEFSKFVGANFLKPAVDPYNLSRGSVGINFRGTGKIYDNYSQEQFLVNELLEVDVSLRGSLTSKAQDIAGISKLGTVDSIPFFNSIASDRFLSYKNLGRKVIYGTTGDDNLDRSDVKQSADAFAEFEIVGGGGNDIINGSISSDHLDGGTGNDVLDGGLGNDYLIGSDGDDTLDGGQGDDYFIGGSGNDTINGGSFVFGLFGGTDKASYSGSSSEYDIEYLPNKSVRISDKVADRNGIDTLTGVEYAVFSDKSIKLPPSPDKTPPAYARDPLGPFNNPPPAPSCPLVLDLDGDGVELTTLADQVVRFDLDQDGFREATGWVKPDDGLLVYDRNGDGFINDLSELFGTQVTTDSGFKRLQPLDTNGDGWVSAADTNFAALQVWRDLDQDAMSDSNELFSLNQMRIARINTTYFRLSSDVCVGGQRSG
jgi:RTX calcium-binding nonapeptide repeat (4 copies)